MQLPDLLGRVAPAEGVRPVFGRYSWDYTAYYPNSGMGYTASPIPIAVTSYYYPYPYYYTTTYVYPAPRVVYGYR